MSIVTIAVSEENATIDKALFKGWVEESHGHLRRAEIEQENFKLLVETIHETTKLTKKRISKYLKAKFSAKLKVPKAEADIFEALDGVLEN